MAGTKRDAEAFAKRWVGRGDENQETQLYWIDLFQSVLGLEDALERLKFEEPVVTDSGSKHAGFIDVLIPSASALVEQKSFGVDLDKPELRQGRMVTPAEQGRGYAVGLPLSRQPRYVITCNFATIRVYDRNRDPLCVHDPQLEIELADLPKNVAALQFLKGAGEAPASVARAVSVEAGRIMGQIHNRIAPLYHDPDSEESHHALSVLCTRIMFLMFCEDAGLIEPGLFQRYVASNDAAHLRRALLDLFAWLDTDDEARKDEYPGELMACFPYMDGGLFRERVPVPQLDETVRTEILVSGCQEFDWSGVDPTVFGSIFEGALSHDTRRAGGMHYTSPENIHRVIDPLFLDDLKAELDLILEKQNPSARTRALRAYHEKLGGLTFLDPACGSGNFLTETYMCLRRLENRVLMELQKDGQASIAFEEVAESPVKVTLSNFHGIEINDFACCVARTALWIAEKQADINTAKVVQRVYDELPLKEYDTVRRGNALRMDWNDAVPAEKCDYIMGNPPFVGHQWRSKAQQDDMAEVFGKLRGAGKLDYVCAWFEKAARYVGDRDIKTSFVATNSICQGESVGILWRRLADLGMSIDFAWRPFVWSSEADDEAHVHVVVVGFSRIDSGATLYGEGFAPRLVDHINGYLSAAPDVFIASRGRSVNEGAPEMTKGSQPTDGGNLIMSFEQGEEFKRSYPEFADLIRPFMGAREFLNGSPRACLYLKGVSPARISKCPVIMDRLRAVRKARLNSPTQSVRALADRPTEFTQDRQPDSNYLVLPKTTSGRRRYIPIGFMTPDVIVSDKLHIIPGADVYLFGLLESRMHQSWMRVVSGRLKSDYEYAPAVYNNFVFPKPTEVDKAKVERCALAVLNARKLYEGSTLADMYDPDNEFLYPELFSAHYALDTAVEAAYGVDFGGDEERIVAHLFKLYAERVSESA